jgi:hypothetical protein
MNVKDLFLSRKQEEHEGTLAVYAKIPRDQLDSRPAEGMLTLPTFSPAGAPALTRCKGRRIRHSDLRATWRLLRACRTAAAPVRGSRLRLPPSPP